MSITSWVPEVVYGSQTPSEGLQRILRANLTSSEVPQSDFIYVVKMINQPQKADEWRTVESTEHCCCSVCWDEQANKEQQALLLFNWEFSWGFAHSGEEKKKPTWLKIQKQFWKHILAIYFFLPLSTFLISVLLMINYLSVSLICHLTVVTF